MKTAKIQNIYSEIEEVLKKDKRLLDQRGKKIVKNKLTELIIKLDKDLIKILSKNKHAKEAFFVDIDEILVFDKQKFLDFTNASEFLPKSYTAFENQIGLSVNKTLLLNSQEVVLDFPYKDCILEGGQEKIDEKRDEVFYNTVLAPDEIDRLKAPKVLANWKKYDDKGIHDLKEWSGNENLIIKGNNLLALYSLLPKYRGQVKLIYIDPPYNRDVDTFYNDNFKHSYWLVFMKNRLELARELLKDDGVIFIQCDDNEYPYLKVLLDSIDGLNYELSYYVQVRYAEKTLAENSNYQKLIEQVLCYGKGNFKPNRPKQDYEINKFCWKITELSKGKVVELGSKKVEIFKPNKFKIEKIKPNINALKEVWATGTLLRTTAKFFKNYLQERKEIDGLGMLYKVYGVGGDGLGYRYFTGPQRITATKGKYYSGIPIEVKKSLLNGGATKNMVINNFYDMSGAFGNCGHEGGVELRSGKKPEIWLKTLMDIGAKKGDLILDFFMGTGGTCAVAHKMGIRYIGIEQLNYGKNSAKNRLTNVIKGDNTGISGIANWKGGGSFVYTKLLQWNEKYADQIEKAKTSKELLKIYKAMEKEAFFRYEVDTTKFDNKTFEKLKLNDRKQVLIDCLDANHLYVNYSEIDDATYAVDKKNKELNKKFYK